MGPLDEAGGWLAFFDSKTRRGGILYALSDTVFFTGPTFGIDYPIAIRAAVRLDSRGNVRGLAWRESGDGPLAPASGSRELLVHQIRSETSTGRS